MNAAHKCACGEPIIHATYHGDRAIADVSQGFSSDGYKWVAPVTTTCLKGHVQEHWVDHDGAMEILRSVSVLAR